ncbi:dual specificity protein phosphatase 18 [Chroicocephalus ridibundus]|uniref:dual specificity protein phosphatase 18 n=1 Tax=Chroicocephalus ridibundus TaxID=1192867 RepID=UPI002FDD1623
MSAELLRAQPAHPNGGGSGSPACPAPAPWITSNLYLSDVGATNSHLLLLTHHISTIINVFLEVVNPLSRHRVPAHPCPHPLLVPSPEPPLRVPGGRPHLGRVLPSHRTTQQWLLAAAHPLQTQALRRQQAPDDRRSVRDEPRCL